MTCLSTCFISVRSAAILALAGASLAACGGPNIDDSTFNVPPDGSVDDTAAGGETATPSDATVDDTSVVPTTETSPQETGTTETLAETPTDAGPVTLDNICARLADALCTSAMSACCTTLGGTGAVATCRGAVQTRCGAEVQAVKDNKTKFNADSFAACVGAFSTFATTCQIPNLDFIETYAPCSQLFNGQTQVGSGCIASWECKAAAGTTALCSNNICTNVKIVQVDQACDYGGADRSYCDYGLYCEFDTGTTKGTCKTAKSLGASCNQGDGDCGAGFYCSNANKCTAGRNAGDQCAINAVCASGNCEATKCTSPTQTPASIVPGICGG
jgi:hypothetical protein